MGVSLVGQGAVTKVPQPIIIPNIAPSNSSTTSGVTFSTTRIFIPKGAYTVTIINHGYASYGSSPSGGRVALSESDLNYVLATREADTGRVGPVHMGSYSEIPQNTIILAKDSLVQVGLYASSTYEQNTRYDVILYPTSTPFTAMPTITGNLNTTAASNAVSGSNSDINWGCAILGWDYDNNNPFVITSYNTSQNYSNWQRIPNGTSFQVWRFNSTTGKWTYKDWSGGPSLVSGSWIANGGMCFGNDTVPMFFIKNNFLHNVSTFPNLQDTSSNAWGWIKADLTTAGTQLPFQPGHTNTAFTVATANITTASSDARMMYTWDKNSGKVIYAGARSSTYNGTYGANNWRSAWAQWDIATDTVEYSNVNSSTADPRIAGSITTLVYDCGVANAADGFIYASGQNGTSEYLAKWNRSGTYTGVGSFYTQYPYANGSFSSRSLYSRKNTFDMLPVNNIAVINKYSATVEYNTGYSQPGLLEDNSGTYSNYINPIFGNFSTGAHRQTYLFMPQGIFILNFAYMKYYNNANSTVSWTAPLWIYKAPMTAANIGAIIPNSGGITSQAYGRTGISYGTW